MNTPEGPPRKAMEGREVGDGAKAKPPKPSTQLKITTFHTQALSPNYHRLHSKQMRAAPVGAGVGGGAAVAGGSKALASGSPSLETVMSNIKQTTLKPVDVSSAATLKVWTLLE